MTKNTLLALTLSFMLATGSLASVAIAEPAATPAAAVEVTDEAAAEAPAAEAPAAEATEAEAPAAEATEAPVDNFSYDALADDTVMASVNGDIITKADIKDAYGYYAQQYSQYGMDFSLPEYQRVMINYVTTMMVQNKLLLQKGAELGFDKLTDEEIAEITAKSQATYDSMLEMYKSNLKDDKKTDEEVAAAAKAYLDENDYTVDRLIENEKLSTVLSRVIDDITKDVAVTDEQVKEAYDKGVKESKEAYDADPAAYETAKSSGEIIYYVPEGYRNVKHILIKSDNALELQSQNQKLQALAADDPARAEIEAKIAELMADVQPKLDDIKARLAAGEDFNALIDEYGEDDGMKAGSPYAEAGYTVSAANTSYVKEFVDGSMALEKVGDVSEPVLSGFGFHFIRYEADIPAGAAAFDDVKDAVKEALVTSLKSEAFQKAMTEWAADAKIEYTEF